jgi:transcriptional regulator with XRE-family HTH domain
MSKFLQKLQAETMRRRGESIRDIAAKLDVSASTVSQWCADIVLTSSQKKRLVRKQIAAGNKGRMMGAEKNRQKRLDSITFQERRASSDINVLTERDLLLLGTALYWGEGVKSRSGSVAIVNSDPAVIAVAKKWFGLLGVQDDEFRPRIFIAESHRSREAALVGFWTKVLDLPESQFGRTVFLKDRRKKVYENHDSYYGVLALRVLRGTTLKYYILGLIKSCKESAGVAQLVRAWHS